MRSYVLNYFKALPHSASFVFCLFLLTCSRLETNVSTTFIFTSCSYSIWWKWRTALFRREGIFKWLMKTSLCSYPGAEKLICKKKTFWFLSSCHNSVLHTFCFSQWHRNKKLTKLDNSVKNKEFAFVCFIFGIDFEAFLWFLCAGLKKCMPCTQAVAAKE